MIIASSFLKPWFVDMGYVQMFQDVVEWLHLNVRENRWNQSPTRQLQTLQKDQQIWLIFLVQYSFTFTFFKYILYFITNLQILIQLSSYTRHMTAVSIYHFIHLFTSSTAKLLSRLRVADIRLLSQRYIISILKFSYHYWQCHNFYQVACYCSNV